MSAMLLWIMAVGFVLLVGAAIGSVWLMQRYLHEKYRDAYVWHLPGGTAVARRGHTDDLGHCYVIEVKPKRGTVTIIYSPPSERLALLAATRALTPKALP